MSSIPPCIPLTPILPLVPSLTEEDLQLSMPDFADLLGIEPATPSPLKHIRGERHPISFSPNTLPHLTIVTRILQPILLQTNRSCIWTQSCLYSSPAPSFTGWQQYHSKGGTLLPAGWNHNVASRYLDQGRYKRRVRNFFLGF
jgi:hypothetical protein